jgi:hypothetical protein
MGHARHGGPPAGIYMSQMDRESTVDVRENYGGVTSPLEPRQFYTNEFAPTGTEYIPPQT